MGLLARGKLLDERVLRRWSWTTKPFPNRAVRFGAAWALVFGGGLLLRVLLLPWSSTAAYELWTYAALTVPGLLLLAHGIRRARAARPSSG